MVVDDRYYFEYIPTDIKSAHALIRRLRDRLIYEQKQQETANCSEPRGDTASNTEAAQQTKYVVQENKE